MNTVVRIGIIVALAIAVTAVVVLKQNRRKAGPSPSNDASSSPPTGRQERAADESSHAVRPSATSGPAATAPSGSPPAAIPRLVDLGAGKCIPCKMMAPILEELKKEYAGRLEVVFIDVWEDPQAGAQYGIRMIPTQIFYDATGKERFRHEGFMSKQDILSKWAELGIDLKER